MNSMDRLFRYNNVPQVFVFYYQGSEEGRDFYLAEPNLSEYFNGNNKIKINRWIRASLIPRLLVVVDVSVVQVVSIEEVLFSDYARMVGRHANVSRPVEPIIAGLLIWMMFKGKESEMNRLVHSLSGFCHVDAVGKAVSGRKEMYAL